MVVHETLMEAAARVTVPVEFILQREDEIVPRTLGLALSGALGSADKTLHAGPGGHMDIPAFEADSSERFFPRHLARLRIRGAGGDGGDRARPTSGQPRIT